MGETQSFHSIHPGTIFKEELAARGLGAASFALHLRVPPRRIQKIVAGKRAITPETALQQAYDLRKVEVELGAKVGAEVSPVA